MGAHVGRSEVDGWGPSQSLSFSLRQRLSPSLGHTSEFQGSTSSPTTQDPVLGLQTYAGADFSCEYPRSELRAWACVTGTLLTEPSLVVLVCHPHPLAFETRSSHKEPGWLGTCYKLRWALNLQFPPSPTECWNYKHMLPCLNLGNIRVISKLCSICHITCYMLDDISFFLKYIL